MNEIGIAAPLATLLALASGQFIVRHFARRAAARRAQQEAFKGWDQVIASIRLRLPPGAELVVLEHQMWFYDERNRTGALGVFAKNGFEAKTAETYDKRTKYWLLASRSTMIDRIQEELKRVHDFATSYGGRYDQCSPQL